MKSHDPFREMEQLFNRLRGDLGKPRRPPLPRTGRDWYDSTTNVAVNVREHPDEFEVTADVPGFEKDELSVSISDDTLTIRAERDDDDNDDGQTLRNERRQKTVERGVSLPKPVAGEESEATYSNGVLSVTVPKVDTDDESVTIEIK